jgi:hypothetical protein
MGLGKTLSSLSLVCHSLDGINENPNSNQDYPKATLIVTPKSSKALQSIRSDAFKFSSIFTETL